MNGLTYFKLQSKYPNDITKNCSLSGSEVDGNFYELEGRDIRTAYLDGDTLTIERLNGQLIQIKGIPTSTDVKYDEEKGVLSVTQNGFTQEVGGFLTPGEVIAVNVNETIMGNGEKKKPIGISPLFKTGQYKPVFKLIDKEHRECLPEKGRVFPGNRFLSVERIPDYGFLYDFDGVRKIANDLHNSSSEWRVPSKEDWDDMLNAIERCEENRNHGSLVSNRYLGREAGKLLKSVDRWRLESGGCECDCHHCSKSGCCPKEHDHCQDTFCGDFMSRDHCRPENPHPNRGVDKFGFSAVPAGYGDDGRRLDYFGERGWYWSSTNNSGTNAYTKRFEYNTSAVYQDITGCENLLSIRLVKDYNGSNYVPNEEIMGENYDTVLMPSLKNGKAIWTSVNIAFTNKYYHPVMPNNGLNLTSTKKYYINEFDGKRWFKNELKEGESVVVLKAPNGNHAVEYRVVKGELVSVSDMVYDSVMVEVNPRLEFLHESLKIEIARAKEVEEALAEKLENEVNRAIGAEKILSQQLEDEIERAKEAELALDEKIENVDRKLDESNSALNEKIDAETQRAKEEEEYLEQLIISESERAKNVEEQLAQDILTERNRAMMSEQVIQENLNNEIERAKTREEQLQQAINAEAEMARQNEEHLRNMVITETERAMSEEARIEAKLDDEIKRSMDTDSKLAEDLKAETERALAAESVLHGRLITQNGSKMNAVEGKLTLMTEDPANTIVIGLDFNFGTI